MCSIVVKKLRSGDTSIISCQSSVMSGTYSWTKDNEPITAVTAQTSGIAPDRIHTNDLEIISMTQQLVGIYQCLLNDSVQNTFDVKIVGKFLYYFSELFIILCCSVQT